MGLFLCWYSNSHFNLFCFLITHFSFVSFFFYKCFCSLTVRRPEPLLGRASYKLHKLINKWSPGLNLWKRVGYHTEVIWLFYMFVSYGYINKRMAALLFREIHALSRHKSEWIYELYGWFSFRTLKKGSFSHWNLPWRTKLAINPFAPSFASHFLLSRFALHDSQLRSGR